MSYDALLNQTCVTYRKTSTKNDYGQVINTWAELESGVACNIQYYESNPAFNLKEGGVISENRYLGFFKKNEDILPGDKVVWQSMTLYVKAMNPVFDMVESHHKEAFLSLQET